MSRYELIAPCHFGLESVLKKEIIDLGYDISRVEDGRVVFHGDEEAICVANIHLRTAERVLIMAGEFTASTYEELFQATKDIDWSRFIPENGKFWIAKAASVKSKLFSPSDIQSVMKKAMVESLKRTYRMEYFPEDGAAFPFRVFILKDRVTIGLDTTGASLHKRGYRRLNSKAPIAENLAAALIMLTPWRGDRILVDPFCGSGTFAIEAAMMAAGIAPGINREFTAMEWDHLVPAGKWKACRDEALEMENPDVETDIQGYDIDDSVIAIARQNAAAAGVEKLIHFQTRPVSMLSHPKKYGFIITNPPYGERIGEGEELRSVYEALGERYKALDSWSMYMITSYEKALDAMKLKADKNRKLYNGMLMTRFYSFYGPKPPAGGKRK